MLKEAERFAMPDKQKLLPAILVLVKAGMVEMAGCETIG